MNFTCHVIHIHTYICKHSIHTKIYYPNFSKPNCSKGSFFSRILIDEKPFPSITIESFLLLFCTLYKNCNRHVKKAQRPKSSKTPFILNLNWMWMVMTWFGPAYLQKIHLNVLYVIWYNNKSMAKSNKKGFMSKTCEHTNTNKKLNTIIHLTTKRHLADFLTQSRSLSKILKIYFCFSLLLIKVHEIPFRYLYKIK